MISCTVGSKGISGAVSFAVAVLLLHGACVHADDDCGYVTKPAYPMAATEEDLERFRRSISDNNTAVFLQLRQEGRARLSAAGIEVCVVERKDADKIRIRPAGGTTEEWTLAEAVKKK